MSRSRAVNLVLLISSVAALEACSRRQCLNQDNVVVDDRYCDGQFGGGPYTYRWYSHSGSYVPLGSHMSSSFSSSSASGTAHGIFGGAGDAHASAHGAGS